MSRPEPIADVCLVVEGCYPFIAGGVSSWLDWLMRTQPDLTFSVVSIMADGRARQMKYNLPSNVVRFDVLPLAPTQSSPDPNPPCLDTTRYADLMHDVLAGGDPRAFDALVAFAGTPVRRGGLGRLRAPAPPSVTDLTSSPAAWTAMSLCYERIAPQAGFSDFVWAWRSLVGGLSAVLCAPVPPARSYHAISTGYAGLFAARAARATGRRAAITEHGIYTNERRIDLLMAEWLNDRVDTGLSDDGARLDLRDVYIRGFESFARVTYAACDRITTLYGANQSFQRSLGACEERLRVIPNGIEPERFAGIKRAPKNRPTVGLIGRVVPIKDIEAYIAAARIVVDRIPSARILVIGPTDEDPAYDAMCRARVAELGLEDNVEFTGKVNIVDFLPVIDVLALTSISEAQPLVILEAGAAGIPCVVTDVGSCREIVEGAPDESPRLGLAGRVAPPMDSAAIGAGLLELLSDPDERDRCGAAMRARVETHFTSRTAAARYGALYRELCA